MPEERDASYRYIFEYVPNLYSVTCLLYTSREIGESEFLVNVKACSLCVHDLILSGYASPEWRQFGHEVAGVVEQCGRLVKNVKPGDKIVLESGTFDRFADVSRNGRVDLDNKGPNFWEREGETMGFAEKIIVPMETCVKFDGISFEAASVVEPMGVAPVSYTHLVH